MGLVEDYHWKIKISPHFPLVLSPLGDVKQRSSCSEHGGQETLN